MVTKAPQNLGFPLPPSERHPYTCDKWNEGHITPFKTCRFARACSTCGVSRNTRQGALLSFQDLRSSPPQGNNWDKGPSSFLSSTCLWQCSKKLSKQGLSWDPLGDSQNSTMKNINFRSSTALHAHVFIKWYVYLNFF